MTTETYPRLAARWPFTAQDACLVGGVVTLVQVGKALSRQNLNESDFYMYYWSALQARLGQPMYILPDGSLFRNHTPPHLEALVLPFTFLPPVAAYLAWSALMLACAWLTLRLVVSAVDVDRWLLAAWLLNAAGAQLALRVGQCSWLVALPVTLAWLAARDERWMRSALWAGTSIAMKPFLLVVLAVYLVRRQWQALALCGIVTGLWLALGVAMFGWANTAAWLSVLAIAPKLSFFTHAVNASLAGMVARAGLPLLVGTAASALLLAASAWRVRRMATDATWLLLLTASLLASPLGWISYLPLLIGPLVAFAQTQTTRGLLAFGGVMLLPALGADAYAGSTLAHLTLGSAYAWGLLALWATASDRPSGNSDPSST